jgi:hypothetical protein
MQPRPRGDLKFGSSPMKMAEWNAPIDAVVDRPRFDSEL